MAYRHAFLQLTIIGGTSIGSFLIGLHFKKPEDSCNDCKYNNDNFSIFGRVFAATPITTKDDLSKVSHIMKYGFPSLENIRAFDDFILSYNRRNRVANWVFEHLTADCVKYNKEVDRSKCEFRVDESIHQYFRSDNRDYKKSEYDRGHLAAAGNHKTTQSDIEQTFYLSNIAPQVGVGFNRNSWNRLEKYVRTLTNVYKDVYCCTGPLYLPRRENDGKFYVKYEVIGIHNVAVPTHFFKVVAGETDHGEIELEAFVMPNEVINDKTPLTSFRVPPESIERAAGLLFFDTSTRKKITKINGQKNKEI